MDDIVQHQLGRAGGQRRGALRAAAARWRRSWSASATALAKVYADKDLAFTLDCAARPRLAHRRRRRLRDAGQRDGQRGQVGPDLVAVRVARHDDGLRVRITTTARVSATRSPRRCTVAARRAGAGPRRRPGGGERPGGQPPGRNQPGTQRGRRRAGGHRPARRLKPRSEPVGRARADIVVRSAFGQRAVRRVAAQPPAFDTADQHPLRRQVVRHRPAGTGVEQAASYLIGRQAGRRPPAAASRRSRPTSTSRRPTPPG